MRESILLDFVASILCGLGFAACARQQFREGHSPWGRELMLVLSFVALILLPVATYFYYVYQDWSWMYFVDPKTLPFGVGVLVLSAYPIALVGAYLGGWALLRVRREKVLYAIAGGLLLVAVILGAVFRRRLGASGSYADWHAGHPGAFTAGKLSWALGITWPGVVLAAVLVGWNLWSEGRRFRVS